MSTYHHLEKQSCFPTTPPLPIRERERSGMGSSEVASKQGLTALSTESGYLRAEKISIQPKQMRVVSGTGNWVREPRQRRLRVFEESTEFFWRKSVLNRTSHDIPLYKTTNQITTWLCPFPSSYPGEAQNTQWAN